VLRLGAVSRESASRGLGGGARRHTPCQPPGRLLAALDARHAKRRSRRWLDHEAIDERIFVI
jgi:hypothetical protein